MDTFASQIRRGIWIANGPYDINQVTVACVAQPGISILKHDCQKSKDEGKYQESIQSSTKADPRRHMEK